VNPPDFDELVGGDLAPRERARLRRAHEALLAAGPPPDLPASLVRPRRARPSKRALVLPLAAALAIVAAFAGGWFARDDGYEVDFALGMHGTPAAPSAQAELLVFEKDNAGNWPMEMTISGLPDGRYELVLTRAGKPAASCGAFLVDGRTVTLLTAPYVLLEYDGWAVIRPGSPRILLRTDRI
jgi:hypothetical protein